MRWRRTAEAGLLLLAGLLNKAGVTLAEEEDGFQRRLSGKSFERSSDRRSTGAKHPRKGGGGRGHGGMAAKAPLPIEDGCPYAIETEEEATLRVGDTSLPGNVVTVEHLAFCRTGNHFINVIRNLAVGYCCKSRVLWLPPKDDVLAPGIFSEGTPGPRWFDFSGAPDVPGFNSSSCSADITWAGQRAFHMYQLELPDHEFYNPGLLKCVARAPRLLGCEAAYYFPKDIDICSASAAPPASDREHEAKRPEKAENPAEMGRQLDLGLSGGENGGQTTTTGAVKDTRWRVQEEASSEKKDGDDWDDVDGEEKGGDRDGNEGGRLGEGGGRERSGRRRRYSRASRALRGHFRRRNLGVLRAAASAVLRANDRARQLGPCGCSHKWTRRKEPQPRHSCAAGKSGDGGAPQHRPLSHESLHGRRLAEHVLRRRSRFGEVDPGISDGLPLQGQAGVRPDPVQRSAQPPRSSPARRRDVWRGLARALQHLREVGEHTVPAERDAVLQQNLWLQHVQRRAGVVNTMPLA